MAFKLVSYAGGNTEVSATELIATGIVAVGDVVMRDTRVGGVIRAQNSAEASISIANVMGVASSATTASATGTTLIKVIKFVAGQLWEADGANNAATNQIMCRNPLSSASVLNNSSTDNNTTAAIFLVHGYTGATTDKKVIGEFIRVSGGLTL